MEEVELPNGHRMAMEVIHHPGAAAVAAVDDDDTVLLLRQFRHAVGGYIWELPAGKLEAGEAPEVCAARELVEETGMRSNDLELLGSTITTPGFCDERIYLFLARSLQPAEQKLDQDEVLTVSRVPWADALAMIRNGELQDAKSIAGLHLAAARLGRL